MAFFNEHADLRLIRTLQHRGIRRATNFRNALTTTNASLEFVDPDLFLLPLGRDVDTTLEANLRITFANCRVEVIRHEHHRTHSRLVSGTRDRGPARAGRAICEKPYLQPYSGRKTGRCRTSCPPRGKSSRSIRSRSEMRLLRMLRLGRVALFAATILCLAYLAFGIVDFIRRPEWGFNPTEADAIKSRLAKLTTESQKVDHWNNLLEDRSKAWAAMESLARMFPDKGGMLVKTYSHTAKPENAPGQAKVGFVKEWKITGLARDEALDYLNTLNSRDGVNAHFGEVARIVGIPAYNPGIGNRSISVNVRTQENNTFKPVPPEETIDSDESTYPFTFDLTITQRFEATDPMALNVPKAP